jgi:uncharacterized protein YigE (DUF2233 family)
MASPAIKLCVVTLLCVAAPVTAKAEPCRSESFEGASYIVCSFDPTKDNLRLFWLGDGGKPYRTFAALAADLESKGKSFRFAMNGGMYQEDFRPVGLYIENGRELTLANIATLTGAPSQKPNFYKKPNGIFYMGEREANILETGRFLANIVSKLDASSLSDLIRKTLIAEGTRRYCCKMDVKPASLR